MKTINYVLMWITFREIQGEGGLISSKIVNVEDEFFRQILFSPPDNPPDSGVNKAILVPANVNALHQRKPKIPLEFRV